MIVLGNCNFARNTNTPIVSKTFFNAHGDVLSLQIEGADGVYHIEGRNSDKSDWVSLAGINLSDFSAVRGGFKTAGIYELGIGSIRQLRARIESTSGNVTIFGQIINTEET